MSAPYATTVLNGRRVFSTPGDPRTEIWFMLYAQVMQADGASYRNILLTHALGAQVRRLNFTPIKGAGVVPLLPAEAPRAGYEFPQSTILGKLIALGLSQTSPLSVLAVELLPYDTTGDRVPLDAVSGAGVDTPPPRSAGGPARHPPDPAHIAADRAAFGLLTRSARPVWRRLSEAGWWASPAAYADSISTKIPRPGGISTLNECCAQ